MNATSTHEQHVVDVAEAMCPDAFKTSPRGLAAASQHAMRADMAIDFAETLLREHAVTPMNEAALREALADADGWAENSSTETGRAYYAGMRDTLRVVLGITTERPRITGPDSDVAADLIIGAQQRQTRTKAGTR